MSLLLFFNVNANGSTLSEALVGVRTSAKTLIQARVSMGPFKAGDVVDIDFDFLDGHTGELLDPVTPPHINVQSISRVGARGAIQTFTYGDDTNVLQLEPGRYRASIDVDVPGTWQFSIVSPGPYAKGTESGFFEVEPILGS